MSRRFKYWFTNTFWYHYKWPTLATLAGIALIVSFIVSMANKVEDDLPIVFVTASYSDTDGTAALEDLLHQELGDLNGDGRISFIPQMLAITNDEMGYVNKQKLLAIYAQQENCLYFYDEITRREVASLGDDVFMDMTAYGYPEVPGYPGLVDVSGSPVIQAMFPYADGIYAAVRSLSEKQQNDPRISRHHEASLRLLALLLS